MALIEEEKVGIGGQDVFHINASRPGGATCQVAVMSISPGILFTSDNLPFIISPEAFNHLADWLKSWGYV